MSNAPDNWSRRLAHGLMNAVLVVYVLVCAIVVFVDRNIDYSLRASNAPLLPNLALLAIAVVSVILFHKLVLQRRATAKEPAHASSGRGAAIIATAALFCYQLVSFYNVGFLTGWDAGTVREASVLPSPLSQTLAADGWYYSYFSRFPNNLLLLILLRAQDRIRAAVVPQIAEGVFFAMVSMLLVSLSFYLFTRVSAKLFGQGGFARLADIIFFVLVGLSPWYMIPYSDTYGLFFCTLMLYLLVCHGDSLPALIALGLLSAAAYSIKPTCIFVLIAACLVWVLESWGTPIVRKALSNVAIVLLAFVVSLAGVHAATEKLGIAWDDNPRFTMSHYLMMGLNDNTDGAFSYDDSILSMTQVTVEAREDINKAITRERLEEYGPLGLARHLVKKTLVCFNDGTFAWLGEGDFIHETVGVASGDSSNFFRSYIYPPESPSKEVPYRLFCTIEQALWLVCLVGIPLGLLRPRGRRNPDGKELGSAQPAWLVIAYCMGAILLFLLAFEARARYLYLYSGYFVLLGMYGYQQASHRHTLWRAEHPRRQATPRLRTEK